MVMWFAFYFIKNKNKIKVNKKLLLLFFCDNGFQLILKQIIFVAILKNKEKYNVKSVA